MATTKSRQLGFVGYLTDSNARFIDSLWREGLVPRCTLPRIGSDNELYNINATHMAQRAEYLSADQLIYLTDVARASTGESSRSSPCERIERLVQSRVVSAACSQAQAASVPSKAAS